MSILLFLLACWEAERPPPTRDDWARIAVEDPDARERLWAITELEYLGDPEVPGLILAGLKRHDRMIDPASSYLAGNKLLRRCMLPPNRCIPCEPCPETAHPACREVDWDRKGCFAGEGDACPVPPLFPPATKFPPCDEMERDPDTSP